ncbi:MAG: glycosyltransferase [Actinophytocola sp.]|nr:glycosyltransferase [Actinophytocola sp.]
MSGKTVPESKKAEDVAEATQTEPTNGHAATATAGDLAKAKVDNEPILTEHVSHGRLLAQRGLFVGPSDLVSKDLYARVSDHSKGIVTRTRDTITVGPNAKVTTNTYFGRFPASYWQRWTTAREVKVELTATGTGSVFVGASDYEGEPRRVTSCHPTDAAAQRITLDAEIDKFFDGGAMWLEIETGSGESLTIENVRWTVDAPEKIRPTAVTICTMNRADDCLSNLRALADDIDSMETLDVIYVADQGTDTVDSRAGFADVAKDLGAKLEYIQQPNLGGAGGFTRGLYEVASHTETEHANVLFMDDDVLLEPDIIVRLTAFSNRSAAPAIIGGQMLNLLHPHQLHRSAEYALPNTLETGQVVKHALARADLLRHDPRSGKPKQQERRVDGAYNGWWACLIPYEVVAKCGYPLPFFFQWDDQEYGFRVKSKGFRTVTLPGAGVWHADFHWKDWDEWHRYFNLRNAMITAALHTPFDINLLAKTVTGHMIRYLLGMQYALTATLFKAIEDFLAGPDVLHDGGVKAMQEIRELRSHYPESKRYDATEVPGIGTNRIAIVNAGPTPTRKNLVMIKRIIDKVRGKHRHKIGQVPVTDAQWWHVALFETAVVTDMSQGGVRLRTYDKQEMMRLAKRGFKLIRRLRKEGPAVREQYKQAMPELTSRENWQRLYRL